LVSLALLTKHLRVRIEKKKKAKPSKQEQQMNTRDPLTSPNALELICEL
jgi:stalled ribosome alternative rescue factor ArfA